MRQILPANGRAALRHALVVLLGVCVLAAGLAAARAAEQETIKIDSRSGVHVFTVEIAATVEERARGLMFRKELPEGRGMLFNYEHVQSVAFWMHNTYLSLDIVFIKADGRILRIAENAQPMSDALIPSGGPVRSVLELLGGTAHRLGIAAGDRVTGSIFGNGG